MRAIDYQAAQAEGTGAMTDPDPQAEAGQGVELRKAAIHSPQNSPEAPEGHDKPASAEDPAPRNKRAELPGFSTGSATMRLRDAGARVEPPREDSPPEKGQSSSATATEPRGASHMVSEDEVRRRALEIRGQRRVLRAEQSATDAAEVMKLRKIQAELDRLDEEARALLELVRETRSGAAGK